jgi:hypothetical protein
MHQIATTDTPKSMRFDGADLEIRAQLGQKSVTIDIMKSGACVHRLTINDAVGRLDNSWIADLFAREDRIELSAMQGEMDDYIGGLDVNQG